MMQPGLGPGQQGPAPGQLKQPVLTDAQRGAEALFTTKTISEIREIEVRTRKDIEQKKLQLRNLVGDSYRDLIDSADKILAIANNTTTILNNVHSIQESFTSLAHNFTSSDALLNEKRDSLTKHEELYAVGSRVKYLVDTPELIWGCLDARRYLDASRRFLRAQHVHDLLASSFSPSVLAKFPLLRHHWPTVTKFKKQVADAVQAVLAGERQLSSDMAADLLASLASLQGMDSTALLQTFLSSRRAMISQLVLSAAAASGDAAPAAAAEVLSALAQAAQLTIAQVGELFLPSAGHAGGRGAAAAAGLGADASCLLQQRCREEEADYSELLFGGRTNTTSAANGAAAAAAAAAAAPEADAWRRTNRAVVERLAALSSGQVEQACVSWLRSVAEDFSAQSSRLLAGLTSAAALVEVEAHVRSAIAGWQHPGLPAAAAAAARGGVVPGAKRPRMQHHYSSGLLLSPTGSARHSLNPVPSAAAAAADADAPHLGSWDSVAEWVVGRSLNVWQEVFHQPFVVRSRELIEASFVAVGRSLDGPLDAALHAAAEAEPEPAGCIITRSWPLEGWDGGAAAGALPAGADDATARSLASSLTRSAELRMVGTGAEAVASANGASVDSAAAAGAGNRAYRQQVSVIQRRFDEDLRSILQAALMLVGTAEAATWPPGIHSTPVSASPSSSALPRMASDAVTPASAQQQHLLQLAHPHHAHHPHHRSSLHTLAAIKRDMQGSRAAELEPFVQSKCIELVTSIAARLQSCLDRLGQPREGPQGAATAEQVVLLGRLASAVGTDSRYLPVVLGSPEAWKAAVSAASGPGGTSAVHRTAAGRLGGTRGAAANARLSGVLEKLRAAAVAAYRTWACWAATSLAGELRALVLADDLLCTNAVPLSWQETVIASEADNALAEPVADMRFSLPASPSVAVLLLLSAACAEIRRAGDHKIAPEALQLFEWELSRAMTSTYTQLLQPGTGGLHVRGVTEKGILQLLLDVRFLRDVLVGGRPVSARSAGAAAGPAAGSVAAAAAAAGLLPASELADPTLVSALAERKREAAALEQLLQDCLDPIDWATYESYLWANEARYFQRVSVLFGGLIQLQRAHPEAAKLTATGLQESNPLNVLPVAARFQYLPISAPAPAAQQPGAAGVAAAATGAGAGGAAAGTAPGAGSLAASRMRPSMGALSRGMQGGMDSLDTYTFADLGSARLGRGGNAAGGAGAEAAAPLSAQSAASVGAAALSALQARLQQQAGSLGSFGSMLGDKAAEVTAMAQQRFGDFGDYLPTSALGSAGGLLSSLAKNVVKK